MDHTRHIGIFNASDYSATLIGAGGIGAMSALALAKMGIGYLAIYDDDKVDDINIPVQFHRLSDVGKPKVIAIDEAIREYVDGTTIQRIYARVTDGSLMRATDITISAVDSISARKGIWHAVQVQRPNWYIDARMSAEYLQIYVVKMNPLESRDWYDTTIFTQDDSQIPDDPCTSKATIYTACMAAGHIGAIARRIVTGKQAPGILTHDILYNKLNWLSFQGGDHA
jgi:molybdopterin/thiamine biosynthesis adenylyltransferase